MAADPTEGDARLANAIAVEAGALLLRLRSQSGLTGSALGDCGDAEANALIMARLRAERPDDFILSEESLDDRARCAATRVWIVDPLDGTRGFAAGDDDWAVHVGLAIAGVPRVGAVALPALGASFASDVAPLRARRADGPLRIMVSRTRCPGLARRVAERLNADLIGRGSAGVKAMAVVAGDADIYLHDGGQFEWDSCAPAAVAIAAGFHASRIDGSPLIYNCAEPLLPDLVICGPELAPMVLKAIAAG